MATVRARMKCTEKQQFESNTNVKLFPFYTDKPDDPNRSYSTATPCGKVELTITNQAAIDAFEVGKFYLIEFTPE